MRLVLPLRPPDGAQARWWGIGALDENGVVVDARNLIVPETRIGDAVTAARFVMQASECSHVVITTGEPDHELLYEEKNGTVIINRLGT